MIDSGTEVSTMHHREVHGYYVALQKYFNNAENKHDRSNSQRAQKARAKLLKLSASQFYELSTDVYDELQRRISDDQSQPEYLLPKASFHMKRNQARQKLANLSHTRFNDLVDDILYEINRRGYNMPPDPETDENTSSNSMAATGSSTPNSRRAKTSHIRSSANQSLGSDASASASNSHIPPTATIQTSQVIPQKASIDWSSDEEQDTKKNDSNTNTNNVNSNISNHNYNQESKDQESKDQESIGAVQPSSISAQQQPNTTPILNPADTYHHYGDVMDSPALTENGANQRGEETLTVGPPRNRHSSAFDFEGISRNELNETKSIQSSDETPNKDQLNQLYGEIEALKKENANLERSRNFDRIALSENLGNEINSLKEEVESLSMENGKLKAKISELETKLKKPRFQSKPALSLPFTNDQNQNELRKLLLDKESVTRYTAQDGSIPFESVRETHEYIQKLFIDLQANVDDIGHALFEDLARLSHTVAQLFILVDVPDYKEEVILLKASLSHAITSIRYFAVYGALLPQITVKAAISELAFAFCNLVRSCKIKGDGRGGTALSGNKAGMTNDTKSPVDPQTPNEAIFPDMPNSKSKSPFNRPAVVNKFDDDDFGQDEMSPVKPLKLTKRACMSPNMRTPSSTRKLSHSGFPFGPMVDTRSPASHEKGSSTTHSFENTRKINETSPTSPYSGNLDSGSLAERVGDFFQDRDVSGKKDESFTDSHDRNDPNRTLNDNVTPEKSTTTSRATTAEGTTRLSTPLSAASPDNYQVKLRESFLGGPNTETQENRELSIQDKKIQNNKDFSKSRDVVGVRDINQDDNDSVDSDNGSNSPNDAYHVNRLPTSGDFPDMKNKTIDTKDSLLPADLSKVENNHYGNSRYPMEAEDSHDLTRSSYSNGPRVEEKQEYLSNSPSTYEPQEPLSHNDSESTVTSKLAPEEIKSKSTEKTKGTPDAIKDTICKLEGNSAPDFEEMSGPGLHEAPVEPKYIQEEPKLTNTGKEIEPKEQEQEKKSGKNIGKSFTEKLRTFATNAGIGLKADKEQKEKEAATSQDKSRNSRDSNSNEGATDISVTENGKTSSISDADSKVPAVSNLNKSSDDNSAVDLFRTTEMRGLETDGNEKITPFEKSFEKNNDEFDDTDSNLGNSKPDNKTGHGKTDEFGVPQISNGLASSQYKKNMKADDELKNGSSLQSPSRDVNGDAAQTDDDMKGGSSLQSPTRGMNSNPSQTDDDMKGGSSLQSPLRGMNDEASQTGYGLKDGSLQNPARGMNGEASQTGYELKDGSSLQSPPRGMNSDASQTGGDMKDGSSLQSPPRGMNSDASQAAGDMKDGSSFQSLPRDVNGDAAQTGDDTKGGCFESSPHGMNDEASQTGGDMKYGSFESPSRDVNGDAAQTDDDMKGGSSLQSPPRGMNGEASQTGGNMKYGSFESPSRDVNGDAAQTDDDMKGGSSLQSPPRGMNGEASQTGGNMKDESFESPPRDVNGDVSQTGDDMKNGSSLQSPLRSLNRDASQTGDDMKNGSFLQSPLRDMNSDASQTGGGIKNGSFLQNFPRSMNSDTVQSISVTPSVTLNDGKREMDITPKDESRTFENRLGHDKGAPSKLPNFYFNNMPQPPTNPNLTDKLKETFADFPSEDENEEGSDFNNSPYMSDNGSVFRAFKQSLKEENAASGSPLIQQHDFHYTDSKTSNEPAGLGISEKTDLKHDNDPAGFSSGLDDSSKFGATKQIEDKNEHLNHISETAPHVASQNHSKEEISKKEHDISASHGKKIEDISHNDRNDQRNRSDFSDSDDIDGSMVNSKSLRQHEKIDSDHDEGANVLSKHTTESKQESPLKESVENENHEGTQERWMSTDEEDNYDSDSFNDALTENNDGPSEQHSNNLQNHPEQRHISDFNDLEDNISDDTHSQRDSRSFNHEDFHSKSDGHDASEVPTIHGTTEERGQLDTTSIDEHSDDLNADPSFAEDKEVSNRPASILNGDAVPQLQPVKVITSNGHSHVPSSDKAESMEDEDVTRSPNIPKTPVMKNSSRPQTMKTPYGNTPFFNSPSGRSPGAKSLASARTDDVEYTFDVDAFDIENPDNTLSELLLYLEHQSLQVIATIQSLLTSIKEPQATKGNLRKESNAISQVIRQMVDATSVSMNQSRNASLKEHGSWVVKSLEDCYLRMITLCQLSRTGKFGESTEDTNYANKHFKQRLAGIAFDIAKCTKELVKTVEEASLKEEIEFLNSRLN